MYYSIVNLLLNSHSVTRLYLPLDWPCCIQDIGTAACRAGVAFDDSTNRHVRAVRCRMTSSRDAVTSSRYHTRRREMTMSTDSVPPTPSFRRCPPQWTTARRATVSMGWRSRDLDHQHARLCPVGPWPSAGPRTAPSTATDSSPSEDRTAASAPLRPPSLWRNTPVPVTPSAEAEAEMARRRARTWRAAVAARRVLRCRRQREEEMGTTMTSWCCRGVNGYQLAVSRCTRQSLALLYVCSSELAILA